jgi:predicted XRE-type DNA-binding protein
MSEQEIEFTESSGNVFADLDFPDPEEALAKAYLAAEISTTIAEQGLSQTKAAEVLGIGQPKVSAIVRGQLRGFSLERLIRCLRALRRDVDIVISSSRSPSTTGHVKVVLTSEPHGLQSAPRTTGTPGITTSRLRTRP